MRPDLDMFSTMNVEKADVRSEVSAIQAGIRVRAGAGYSRDRTVTVGQCLCEYVSGEPLQLSRIVGAVFHDLLSRDIDQLTCEIIREFLSHGAVVDDGGL
jgi:hypothetical protein